MEEGEKKAREEEEKDDSEDDEEEEISRQAKKKRANPHEQDNSQETLTPSLSVKYLGIPGVNSGTSSDLISHISSRRTEKSGRGAIHVAISSAASSGRGGDNDDEQDDTMAQRERPLTVSEKNTTTEGTRR